QPQPAEEQTEGEASSTDKRSNG
ncbi:hypothetical protein JCM5350_004155, partial [Sporobolomyces pararoseus]